ncbi:MAG: hypothetical protein HY649_08570, partial [Acidobacteria bacterium]|nr:hypothetical protein [Acidobacteriota bacterium]
MVLAAAALEQAVSAPDALQGSVAERQVKLADQAASAEGGQAAAQLQGPLLQLQAGLASLPMRGARAFLKARGTVLLMAAKPFAHGREGRLKGPRRSLDAV